MTNKTDPAVMQRIAAELARREGYPQRDYSDKHAKAAALIAVEGHPLQTLARENDALEALLARLRETCDEALLAQLSELAVHYAKKGDLLYPLLKVRYGVAGPSDLMWTTDDEIRAELSALTRDDERGDARQARLDALLRRVENMILQERHVLFPICAVNFTEDEWRGIYRDEADYGVCFGVERAVWDGAAQVSPAPAADGEIVLPGGNLTLRQLTALLNVIPMEITFVDDQNINRFFNEGPKVFKRPQMALGREVFSCHPPKIEPMVRQIVDDFRAGRRDSVPVWMEKDGRPMLVRYMSVRDRDGAYLGTVELVQDMTFAREHFSHAKNE